MSALKKSRQIITIKNKKIEKLSLRYENIPIDNLSITKYAIWNSGNVEIRREDIASLKPLKIKSNGDIKILDASIIRNTDEDNGFTITHVSEGEIEIGFEYVNEKNGTIVQIIHEGSGYGLWVDCKIKGGRGIKNVNKAMRHAALIFTIMLGSLYLFEMGATCVSVIRAHQLGTTYISTSAAIFIITIMFIGLILTFVTWMIGTRIPRDFYL